MSLGFYIALTVLAALAAAGSVWAAIVGRRAELRSQSTGRHPGAGPA